MTPESGGTPDQIDNHGWRKTQLSLLPLSRFYDNLVMEGSAPPREATKDEIQNLRHVVDKIPQIVWLVAFAGAAQSFAYWGTVVPWQNYMQNPPGDPRLPGVLGLGQSRATIINNAFLVFADLTPLPLAIVSDAWIGKYKTLILSLSGLLLGNLILFITSTPKVLHQDGAGVSGLVIAMVLVGLGQGGVQAVIYPLIGDQIPEQPPRLIQDKKGHPVVADRTLSIQYAFNVYYWMINIAALSSIVTTTLEKYVSFWAAFLLPTCFLSMAFLPLLMWNKHLVKPPPKGNVLPQAIKVLSLAIRSGFNLGAAYPSYQQSHHHRTPPWTEDFVTEIKRGLKACRVIICFALFYLCYDQVLNNLISQAGQMKLSGISNDTIQSLNPIACIILGPLIQNILFPFVYRRRIPFGPILRISIGFFFIALGMAYAAGIQKLIYSRAPCYDRPLACAASQLSHGRSRPNNVSVWVQIPVHFILGVGEILGLVSLSEYAYAEAPQNIKAVAQGFKQLTAAIGAALGIALGPVAKDPWLVVMYATLAGVTAAGGLIISVVFRRYDSVKTEESEEGEAQSTEADLVDRK